MIKFEAHHLNVEHIWIKSVTGALGGSLTYLDKAKSTATKEVFLKRKIPLNVARAFMKINPMRSYLKPVLSAMMTYKGRVVALERNPLGNLGTEEMDGLSGKVKWESECESNFQKCLALTRAPGWFFDGRYVYNFDSENVKDLILKSRQVSSNGSFREVRVRAIDLSAFHLKDGLKTDERVCLSFMTSTGQYALSPPIWKTLYAIGQRQVERNQSNRANNGRDIEDENISYVDNAENTDQFDKVDEFLSVNLNFIIRAGRELTDIFGYDSIEPLNLPQLMLRLRTVNLPNVALAVKSTFDSGLKFSHAAAWLIGLLNRVDTLESYVVVRSLLKYLTTKGVYRKNAFSTTMLYHAGKSELDVPLVSLQETLSKDQD